jgi:hypothetical protein
VAAANLRLGMQEQWQTLQQPDTFADPLVSEVVGALTPSMSLTDATGTHELLPNGGNWADFADRMGLIEVDPATLPPGKRQQGYILADAQGHKHHFILNPDRKAREGSIFEYFSSDRSTQRAQALIDGRVRPDEYQYDDARTGWKGLWEGVKSLTKRVF